MLNKSIMFSVEIGSFKMITFPVNINPFLIPQELRPAVDIQNSKLNMYKISVTITLYVWGIQYCMIHHVLRQRCHNYYIPLDREFMLQNIILM